MPILNKGTTFATNDQVTSAKLNNLVDTADFTNTSGTAIDSSGTTGTCVSDGGLEVTDPGGQLQIKDSGVTKSKIENVANMKVLGNTSGSATAPQEVTINDTDDMSDASATTLATSESIKAYVDSNAGDSYNLYRTVNARGGISTAGWRNWSANLRSTADLGAFGTGSSGTDQPFIFTFSATGSYLIEINAGIEDSDSDANDTYGLTLQKTSDGAAYTTLSATTSTGGSGGLVSMDYNPGFDHTHSAPNTTNFIHMSFIYIVGNTSTDNLAINIAPRNAASTTEWEGAGILKITKL